LKLSTGLSGDLPRGGRLIELDLASTRPAPVHREVF